ncbi:MFS transporter [Alkalicoccus daliensis]|uniref:MFS transporter, DHA2 family, metal-tetracycline-proton antiporter n=1 Tax=Alkalicoccus daliensis TaxID=745820 RepID=A0A1G9ZGG0_9BACI|nr:MFS transporter [Alkalicoccus daliensis]SDN20532.1 MFS transporter, DHA2 family, metal-tetracycline-proton antiporter [Alkalicoccus daliensis]
MTKETDNTRTELTKTQKNRLVLMICIILTFTVMNGTMFNVAIPDIAEDFNLLPSQVTWVMTGYILVFAIGALMYGKLADIYPIKRLLTFGIILFATGAAIGLFSQNYPMLLAARLIQAMGGATIPALAFIIPARFMPKERGRVYGTVSATVAFASGLGPITGGLVGGAFDWRYLFILSILSLFSIPFLRRWIPDESVRKGTVDIPGAAMIAAAIAGLLFAITALSLIGLFVFITAIIIFVFHVRNHPAPFIDPSMLKNKYYTTAVMTSFLGTSVMFGMIFIVPIMARAVYGLDTMEIGLLLFPGALGAALIGQRGGYFVEKKGSYPVLQVAFILAIAGSLLISTFIGLPPYLLALCILVQYTAFPLIQSSTANLLTELVPEEKTGVGIGMFNLMNFMSGAISSAIFGAFLDLERVSLQLNPFALSEDIYLYSNLFLAISIIALAAIVFFTLKFRHRISPQNKKFS